MASMAEETLFEFPCDFPVKIMGRRDDDFAQQMLQVVLRHAPDFDPATVDMRPSRNGNYLSLTCVIHATSKAQLDGLYLELTRHPLVKMAL